MVTKTKENYILKLLDYQFRIKTKYITDVYGFPNAKDSKGYHNQFNVSITNMETKKRISFKFYGSIADYQEGKDYIEKSEYPFLVYCFLSDSHSGYNTFDDFCSEFGYDTDSRNAEKIYKLCIRSQEKAYKLGIQTESELCDLMNELNEKYDC